MDKDPYHQLAESFGFMGSKVVPEILKQQVDLKDVKLLLSAAPPATTAELSDKTGIPEDEVERMIDALFIKGMVFKSKKEGVVRYYRARHVIQFHDANLLTPGLSETSFNYGGNMIKKNGPETRRLSLSLCRKPRCASSLLMSAFQWKHRSWRLMT